MFKNNTRACVRGRTPIVFFFFLAPAVRNVYQTINNIVFFLLFTRPTRPPAPRVYTFDFCIVLRCNRSD